MSRTLYVTDLDGTLLNTKDQISKYSRSVLNDLVEQGMLFTYATARSLSSALVVTEGLTTKIPVIAYNGAFIREPYSGNILRENFFTEEEKTVVVQILQKFTVSPLVYAFIDGIEQVSWVSGLENEGMLRYLSLRKGDKRLHPIHDRNSLYDGRAFYFTCIGEKEALLPLYEELQKTGLFTCILQQELYRPEYWCEIMPKNVSKANAILQLKELWQCDQVISFGDGKNDIPMFQISDACYAVENAVPELKKLATGVIASNEEDGVAKWLLAHVSRTKSLVNGRNGEFI